MKRAAVIGSGPNGLAAAITMARAGWRVTVHEASETIGGGVRSEQLTLPGFVHDVCSAIHPLGRGSPFFRELELGVEWVHAGAPAAHPFDDGSALVLERDIEATATALGRHGGPVVERVRGRSLRLNPVDGKLEVAEERRLASERVDR